MVVGSNPVAIMETQYLTNNHNVVSMLASLMRHKVKDYHQHFIYISL